MNILKIMKQLFTLIILLLFVSAVIVAQDELVVEAGPAGTLEQAIFGDTTETGERMNPNRVYILRRGTPYLLSQTLRWGDYKVNIKAEEGEGAKPLIVFSPAQGESVSSVIRTNSGASLNLDGIHLSGRDLLGNVSDAAFRIGGDSTRVVVNDCIITDVGQSIMRFNATGIKAYFTNSLMNRIGEPTNPNNGRMFDTRGNPVDTAWVENCVVYDVTSRIYRSAGGDLNYGLFNQNTFYASAQEGFTFSPANNLIFTNSIVAEPVFLGQTDSTLRYAFTMDTFISGQHKVDISYNNIYVSDEFEAALPATRASGDSLYSVRNSLFGPNISNAMMESASPTTNISEALEFANPPNIPTQFIEADAADTSGSGNRVVEEAGSWDFSDLTADPVYSGLGTMSLRYAEHHDFSYPGSALSFTAGNEGQAIGADLSNLGTDVDEDYFITDNILYYPNPVRESLFIQNLDKAELSTISIYNMTGQRLIHRKVEAINARFELGELPSGSYVLTVLDRKGKVSSRKLIKR